MKTNRKVVTRRNSSEPQRRKGGSQKTIPALSVAENDRTEWIRNQLAAIVESSDDAIIGKTLDGIITSWNEGARRIYGYGAEEVVGRQISILIPPDLKDELPSILKRLGKGERIDHYETARLRKDDQRIDVSLTISPIRDTAGKIIGASTIARDITDRKQSGEALKKSENDYRYLFEHANDVIVILEPEQEIILEANAMACKTYGFSHNELVGMSLKKLTKDVARGESHIKDFLDRRPQNNFESVHLDKNGREIHFLINCSLIEYLGGKAILSINRDITERKQAEKVVAEERNLLLTLINNLPDRIYVKDIQGRKTISNTADWQALGEKGMEGVIGKTDFDTYPAELATQYWADDKMVLDSGKPVINREEPNVDWQDNLTWTLTTKVPLRDDNGQVVGLVGIGRDVTERKHAEERLRENEAMYRLLFDSAPVGILLVDTQGKILEVNPAALQILGSPSVEATKEINLLTFQPLIEAGISADFQKGIDSAQPAIAEYPYTTKWGKSVFITLRFTPLFSANGNLEQIQIIMEDVTERKRAEEALALSEERFRSIIELGSDALSLLDETGTVVYSSPVVLRLLGYTLEERLGHDAFELVHPDDLSVARDGFRRVVDQAGASLKFKERLLHKDGNWRWFETTVTNLLAVPALRAIVSHSRDITEQVRAEEALRKTEEKYRNIFENVIEAITQTTPEGRYLTANPAAARMMGYNSPEALITSVPDLDRQFYVKPGRREEFKSLMEKRGSLTDFESEVYCKDGSTIWISENSHTVRGGNGTLLYYEGTAVDISERKIAENALRESEQKFRNLVEQSADGIVIANEQGLIVDWNHGEERISGIKRADVLGRPIWDVQFEMTPDEMKTPALRAEIQKNIRLLLSTGQAQHLNQVLESTIQIPDGTRRDVEVVIYQFQTNKGFMAGSISHDITERKQAEEKILQQFQRLSTLRDVDLAISSNFDLQVTLNVLLGHVTAQLGMDAAAVLLFHQGLNELEFAAGQGFHTANITHLRLKLGEEYSGRAALERRTIAVFDLAKSQEPFNTKFIEGEGFAAFFAVPLIAKGKVKGVLEVFRRSPFKPDADWLNFLEALAGQAAIAIDNSELFGNLQQSNLELQLAYDKTIEGWSRALDLRDKETEGHTQRVTQTALRLASALGLGDDELISIRRGALLHDIGKMGVPDHILFKPAGLTEEEWVVIKKHPQFAFDLISPIDFLRPALDIPYGHHEKWDGTGYPRGLKGEQIPLTARIFAVVDVYDALTSDRPYRLAWTKEKALEYIQSEAGAYFDPNIVREFIEVLKKD